MQIAGVLPGPPSGLGLRIATHVVSRWEDRPGDDPLLMMLRPDAREAAAAVGALIMGSVVQWYVLQAGPAAEATTEHFTAWLAPALQRLLTGPSFPLPS